MYGDDLHSPQNVAKMSSGQPLNDVDGAPWLQSVGAWLSEHPDGGMFPCLALRCGYRDQIRRTAPEAVFLHLPGEPALLDDRVSGRTDHFMSTSLLASPN